MTRFMPIAMVSALALCFMAACSTEPTSPEKRADLQADSAHALATAQSNDSSLIGVLHSAAGYAVFPTVGKGAVGVGGAHGRGILYEHGQATSYCDLSQATIGVQLGGQAYTEIVCFQDQNALNRFKGGDYTFDAQATAVALKSGAGANAKYANGVAVFTMGEEGLMYEASVGGQKFRCRPMNLSSNGNW